MARRYESKALPPLERSSEARTWNRRSGAQALPRVLANHGARRWHATILQASAAVARLRASPRACAFQFVSAARTV